MTEVLTQRKIARFWLPLAAMWILMALEQPMLSAVIARMPEPTLNLAAWGLTFALGLIIESPVIMFLTLGTALAKDRQSYRRLLQFTHIMAWGLTALHLLVGLTPLYAWIVGGLVGAPPEVIEPSRTAFLLMTPWAGAIAYRRMWQGVLIRYGRPGTVAYTTAIRLAATAVVALAGLLTGATSGANVAALSLSAGVLAGAASAYLFVRGTVRERLAGDDPDLAPLTWPVLLKFYVPLALTSFIVLIGTPIINLGLSRGPRALESLAVWPVVNGLLFLLRSTGVALQEVIVALLRDGETYVSLRRFSYTLAGVLTLLTAAVTLTPLSTLWFTDISGLPPDLVELARVPAALLVLVPALTTLTSWQRGVLIYFSRTTAITIATVIHISVLYVSVIAGAALLPWPGAITAALAWTAALTCEVGYLTFRAHGARQAVAWA
ncbi:MAG: hypothetical protein R2844_00260 [Caldilineales bacterium]